MKLLIFDDYEAMSAFGAQLVARRINNALGQRKVTAGEANVPNGRPLYSVGLPTGGTPLGMYRKLTEVHKAGQLSFANVGTFNMDEYVGIPRNHPHSYHTFMFSNFSRHIDIDPSNVWFCLSATNFAPPPPPHGNAVDLNAECANYERSIASAGCIDLFVSGIGSDGHIAFNEPGSIFISPQSRTRVQSLDPETIAANARFFDGDRSRVPRRAITVGVGTIMEAKEVLLLVNGAHKARALRAALEKGISHMCTASALQQHPNCVWLVDEDATMELKVKTVKYWKSQHEENVRELLGEGEATDQSRSQISRKG
ncbi:hypothetical protein niasHT_018327 [Heterodera trifolii]|uniref:Glucosamine-6-phosphate isomerase n=1 Tax=Heterodera trifolii TaxID=157864 RepID=A0ABD2L2Y5_9BILA